MPRGGKRERSGRKPKTLAEHLRDGTFRKSIHSHLLKERPKLLQKPAPTGKAKCGRPQRFARSAADERAIANGCYFDARAANYVVEWFAKYLRHSKGQWAGRPFELLDWQRDDVILPLFGWMRKDGKRRFRITYIEISKKNGKPLDADTPIPTPSGWSRIGDLKPNDEVFDIGGVRCRVVAVSPPIFQRCFRLRFSDGSEVIAGEDHQWVVYSRHTYKARRVLATTGEMYRRPTAQGRPAFIIDVAGAIETDTRELQVEPYLLGMWLANGDSDRGRVTIRAGDTDASRECTATWRGVSSIQRQAGCARYYIPGLLVDLRNLGVLKNKHIPQSYLRASSDQRFRLLAGLMDGDGCISKEGLCTYWTTVPALRDGVIELLRSLGYQARVVHRPKTKIRLGKQDAFCIYFSAYRGDPISLLPRKLERMREIRPRRRSHRRAIVSIEPVERRELCCIQVSSPTQTYLCGHGFVPTHNSSLASGVGLYLLCGDGEQGSEVYSTAATKDQASIVHGEAIRMVESSPELAANLSINHTTRNISHIESNSCYRALASEAGSNEGLNAHGMIVDELHVWRGDENWNQLMYAGRGRRQPLRFVITTAGDDEASVCFKQYEYAKSVLEGRAVDERFFGYIRELAPEDDYRDPANWKKANPSLGITINEQDFAADLAEAEKLPATLNTFLRYSFDRWISGLSDWLPREAWHACGLGYDEQSLRGQKCWAGLDLSQTTDMTALVLCFPDQDETVKLLSYFWLPENAVANAVNRAELLDWGQAGYLTITNGDVMDYESVIDKLGSLKTLFKIQQLAFDPWAAEHTTQIIETRHGIARVEFRQTLANFASPTAEFERLVVKGALHHNNHPILSRQAGHVRVKTDANNNKRPVKPPHGDTRKIDGIVAAIMALGITKRGGGKRESVYERRGVLVA